MKMKRFGVIVALFVMLFGCSLQSQAQLFGPENGMKGRVVYGGNFGFGVSGYYLNLLLAPQVGYRITNSWEIGVRGTYNLQCYFNRVYGNETYHWFGPGAYTNLEIAYGIFAHAEYEGLYCVSNFNHQQVATPQRWFNSYFAGGGYRTYMENGSFAYFMILYNLGWHNINVETPYRTPVLIRVGYCF